MTVHGQPPGEKGGEPAFVLQCTVVHAFALFSPRRRRVQVILALLAAPTRVCLNPRPRAVPAKSSPLGGASCFFAGPAFDLAARGPRQGPAGRVSRFAPRYSSLFPAHPVQAAPNGFLRRSERTGAARCGALPYSAELDRRSLAGQPLASGLAWALPRRIVQRLCNAACLFTETSRDDRPAPLHLHARRLRATESDDDSSKPT